MPMSRLYFSVPPSLARQVASMAKAERRTKSELFREIVRVYRRYCAERDQAELQWVMKIVAETKAEEERSMRSQARRRARNAP